MAETDISPDHPAVKADEFRVTGLGYYRTRGKEVAYLKEFSKRPDVSGFGTTCRGYIDSGGRAYTWYSNGRFTVMQESELDLIAGPFKTVAEAKAQFRITGPGRYRNKRDEVVTLRRNPDQSSSYPWKGDSLMYSDLGHIWHDDTDIDDIVAGPFPQDPVAAQADTTRMAGHGFSPIELTERNTIVPRSSWMKDIDMSELQGRCGDANAFVDWSKVPLDAIVKPKRVKGWVNMYAADQELYERGVIWPTREEADEKTSGVSPRIACIEVEFVEGQGLGDGAFSRRAEASNVE